MKFRKIVRFIKEQRKKGLSKFKILTSADTIMIISENGENLRIKY